MSLTNLKIGRKNLEFNDMFMLVDDEKISYENITLLTFTQDN